MASWKEQLSLHLLGPEKTKTKHTHKPPPPLTPQIISIFIRIFFEIIIEGSKHITSYFGFKFEMPLKAE